MKQVEIDTTKIAKMLCKAMGQPDTLWELALPEAYDILYLDPTKAKELVRAYDARGTKKKAKKRVAKKKAKKK